MDLHEYLRVVVLISRPERRRFEKKKYDQTESVAFFDISRIQFVPINFQTKFDIDHESVWWFEKTAAAAAATKKAKKN